MKYLNFTKEFVPEFVEAAIPKPTQNQVLLKIKSFAFNRADLLQIKGSYSPPPGAPDILGLEAIGYIKNQEGFDPEKLYCALLPGGGYAQYAAVHRGHLFPAPPGLDAISSGCIPEVWLTAFLHTQLARVQEGDVCFINAGASGVGTALIQILKHVYKAESVVSCSTQEKIDFCKNLGAKGGALYKEIDQEERVKNLKNFCGEKGYDIAFDCVGKNDTDVISQILGQDSRWVLYGLLSGAGDVNLLGPILRKRINIIGTTLRARSDEFKTKLVSDFGEKCLPLFESGVLKPILDESFEIDFGKEEDLEIVKKAQEKMRENKTKGKLVIGVKE